jgi:hypothetical protein
MMALKKVYSGYTEKSMKNLLLDSGAYFKNFEIGTDTFESAVDAGKLIGATQGGGQFVAKGVFRQIEFDGVLGKAKGADVLEAWEVSIQANVKEITTETLALALGLSYIDTTTDATYNIVTGKNHVEEEDYIDNITWVGTLSGSDEPVIIQVYNAFNTEGLTLDVKPKSEAVISMKFEGRYDATDLDTPPFNIYYPKAEATTPIDPEDPIDPEE